jgi:antirestriction protein ArdC
MEFSLGRLNCHCVFTESAQRLKALLDKLEKADKQNAKDLKAALALQEKLYQEHVTEHNAHYIHSFVEFNRTDTHPVIKTSAYTAGDLKRARQGPTKKRETEKTKKKRKTKVKKE